MRRGDSATVGDTRLGIDCGTGGAACDRGGRRVSALTPWAGVTALAAVGATLGAARAGSGGAARGTGTDNPWMGVVPDCDAVLGVRMAGAYAADAGMGIPFPGLMPGLWRISGRTGGVSSAGALATAPADTGTRLAAMGLRPARAGAGTAVRPPGADELA